MRAVSRSSANPSAALLRVFVRYVIALRVIAFCVIVLCVIVLCVVAQPAGAQVAGELRGRIVDAIDAHPLAGARVEIAGRADGARTSTDGRYVIRGLDPGTYTVRFRALGYTARDIEASVANGRSVTIDVRMEPTAAVLAQLLVVATRDTVAPGAYRYSRTDIENSGRRDLGELLQGTPGVVVTQSGGAGQRSTLSVRGANAGQTLVLLDGVPINSALTGEADLSQVPLETVQQVTVRTGAQSARYGPRAMAGVIEIVTRRTGTRELSSLLRAGAYGERDQSVTAAAAPTSVLHASATVDHRAVDGDFDYDVPAVRGGGRSTRVNSDATTTSAVAMLTLDPASDEGMAKRSGARTGTGTTATGTTVKGTGTMGATTSGALKLAWQRSARGLAGSIVQASTTGRQSGRRVGTGISMSHRRGLATFDINADVTSERVSFRDAAPPFGAPFDDTVSATGGNVTLAATVTGARGGAATGVDIRTLDVSSTLLASGAPHWQRNAGLWSVLRTGTMVGTTGVRLDGELSGRVDASSLAAASVFSPQMALRAARGGFTAGVSIGSGFAPPTLADQFFHEGVQTRANPSLRPERVRHDVEFRAAMQPRAFGPIVVSADGALYRADIDGMILWLPDFRFVWSPSNFDVQRRGSELSASVGLPSVHVDLQGTVNRTDVRYAGGVIDGQVAYRPRETASASLAFTPGAARIQLTHRAVGARRTVPGSGLNSLEPYRMTDLTVSTTVQHVGWMLNPAVGLENLFGTSAAMLVDYPFPPRTWTLSLRVRRRSSNH